MIPYFNYAGMQSRDAYEQSLKNVIEQATGQLQQIHNQPIPTQPTNLTQNFQIASSNGNNLKIVNGLDDVQKEIVIADTFFISKSMTDMWIKSTNGNIRTFQVQEIVPKDEKDIMIESLQKQIEDLKGGMYRDSDSSNGKQFIDEQTTASESQNDGNVAVSKTSKRKS